MLAILLLGSLLLFGLIFYILKWVSGRSNNVERSTRRVLQVVLCISILVLIVQDYILTELPHNGIIIATFIAIWFATMVPNDRVPLSKEANRKSI
jgi:predicted MFS family arabinose efflux permease